MPPQYYCLDNHLINFQHPHTTKHQKATQNIKNNIVQIIDYQNF